MEYSYPIGQNDALELNPKDQERLDLLLLEMEVQSESPYEEDDIVKNFFQATLTMWRDNDPQITDVIDTFVDSRPEIVNGPHAALLLFRIFNHHARKFDADYPNTSYGTQDERYPDLWMQTITGMLNDEAIHEEIFEDIKIRNVQSNKFARAMGLVLPMAGLINSGRFEKPIKILEVGGSRMHITKFLALMGVVPGVVLEPVEVIEPESGEIDIACTDLVNRFTDYDLNMGQSISVDIVPLSKADNEQRVFSDSFLPSEIIKNDTDMGIKRKINNFWLLERVHPPVLEFVQMDFSDASKTRFFETNSVDIVLFPSVLYQLSKERRDACLRESERITTEDGLIIIQDEIKINESDPSDLTLYKHWSEKWQYNTIAKDMHQPDEYQHLITWDSARCTKLIFELGKLSAGRGSFKSLPELLESQT